MLYHAESNVSASRVLQAGSSTRNCAVIEIFGMSFGYAIGDLVSLGTLTWRLYKCCKGAPARFREIEKELNSLHNAVRTIRDEAQKPSSLLMYAKIEGKNHFHNIIHDCIEALEELEQSLLHYNSLGTQNKRIWDRIGFGSERTQGIRERIVLHTSALNLSMTSLGIDSLSRIEGKLDGLATQICAGQHVPSIIPMRNKEDEQENTRRLFATELPAGFPRAQVRTHNHKIQGCIRGLIERGDLGAQPARPAVCSPEYLAGGPSESKPGLEILLPCYSTLPNWPVLESAKGRSPSALVDRPAENAALSSMAHNEPFTIPLRARRIGNKGCVQSATLDAKDQNAEATGATLPLSNRVKLSPTKGGSSKGQKRTSKRAEQIRYLRSKQAENAVHPVTGKEAIIMQEVGRCREKGRPAEVHAQKAKKVLGIQEHQEPATFDDRISQGLYSICGL